MSQVKGAKADCFYGSTGTYKTSNIGRAALYAMKKYGKPTRLVSADGGGWEPLQSLVDSGVVIPWQLRDRKHQIESIDMACQGYWPVDVNDPLSQLVAPFVVRYSGTCPNTACGEVLISKQAPPQQKVPCPKCKTLTLFSSNRINNPDNDLSDVAIVAFEGLTSFGDLILSHLQKTGASLSQDPSYRWQDGETTYSGGNMTYYGFAQSFLYEVVMKSNMLPVEKVIWSALEAKGEDEVTRSPIYGPAIAGKKATGKAGAWFGNLLHFDASQTVGTVEKDDTLKTGMVAITTNVRMYLRPHADGFTKIIYPAKTRAPFQYASEMGEYMEPSVDKLYEKLDALKVKATEETNKIKQLANQNKEKVNV